MAMRVETNRRASLRPQQAGAGECAPELELLVASLAAALEQALFAAQRLLGALDGTVDHRAHAATGWAQGLRLLTAIGPCGIAGQPACRCAEDLAGVGHSPLPASHAPAGLTRREREVLRLLATGQSNQCIARLLCLSPRTVQRHIANLYPKVGAHNRAEATAYALRHDLT